MKRSAFIAVMLMTLDGCYPKANTASEHAESFNVEWWCNGGKNQSRLICEVTALPKATFLEIVATSSTLTQEDKKIVANAISPDVYTHATLQKAECRNTRFLVIDQFYPKRTIGIDNKGHELVEGGAGSLELIVPHSTNGIQSSVVHYD